MTISEIGAIGELVGGVAVLATLVYLAVQVREARKALVANTYQSRTDSLGSRYLTTATDTEFLMALFRETEGEDLTALETYRAKWYWRAVTNEIDNAHFQWQQGTFPPEQISAIAKTIGPNMKSSPLVMEWWESNRAFERPEFSAWVDKAIDDASPAPANE